MFVVTFQRIGQQDGASLPTLAVSDMDKDDPATFVASQIHRFVVSLHVLRSPAFVVMVDLAQRTGTIINGGLRQVGTFTLTRDMLRPGSALIG